MNKMTQVVKTNKNDNKSVVNFMGGHSYEVNPIDTLKMVTASSIFGEPQYYRTGEFAKKTISDGVYTVNCLFEQYSVIKDKYKGEKTSDMMERIIDEALSYDFKETLEWAKNLRTEFYMRLNPQVIMVRAAMHPDRNIFTSKNPGLFAEINNIVMSRADEPISQLTYYLYKNKNKKNIPGILKKSWKKKVSGLKPYQLNKYKGAGLGMIDMIRICHANSPQIDKLMTDGTISITDTEKTWESLRASRVSWEEILNTVELGHMALLRNLKNIFTEIEDIDLCKNYMDKLKKGVLKGKQFPFRYKTAMDIIDSSDINHKQLILDTLEECIDISCENLPTLKGKTMCLSDNSGSALSAFNSEYGSVTVATIGNLSSTIAAHNSDEGYVGVFGDKLKIIPISKREGLLSQTKHINKVGKTVGVSTENGVWLFFKNAIEKKEHWDNIIIYSDMQAGHGGLYGLEPEQLKYRKLGFAVKNRYIDVAKLIAEYRKINPKVNVYCIQTAGYNNVLVPEYGYRTNLFYGWTGKELLFMNTMNRFWDQKSKISQTVSKV